MTQNIWAPFAFTQNGYEKARESGRVFNFHFVLSAERMFDSGSEFDYSDFAGFYLYTGARLDSHRASLDTGLKVLLLGIAVDADGHVVDAVRLRQILALHPDLEGLATYLCACAGRYVFVVSDDTQSRLYLDPAGMLGTVYNPSGKTAASLATLAVTAPMEPALDYPFWETAAHPRKARFAFGYTLDRRAKQLLPNTYLDLKSWTTHRHWPTQDQEFTCASLEEARDTLRVSFERHVVVINALVKRFPASFPVSGGQDSRLLLAFASGCLDRVERFYTHVTNFNTSQDMVVAKLLCEKMGVEHHSYQVLGNFGAYKPRLHLDDLYRRRMLQRGHILEDQDINLTGFQKRELAAHEAVPDGHIVLRGHVTDISKAVFWRRLGLRSFAADPQSPIPPEIGLILMQIRPNSDVAIPEDLIEMYQTWQDTLPANTHARSIDFLGLEQHRPYSLSAGFYAAERNFYLPPGNDRTIIAALTRLPPDFRAALHANDILLDMAAKQLAGVPSIRKNDNDLRLSRPAAETFF